MSKNISEQLIVYLVMDFLNEANVEHIQNLTPSQKKQDFQR